MPEQDTTERWLPVVGWEGWYSVSDRGRVRRDAPASGTTVGRILSGRPTPFGHLLVELSRNDQGKGFLVHRLVLEAFVGPCSAGEECCHWNGRPGDNRLKNLRWGTSSENKSDMIRHGRSNRGEKSPGSKLTEKQVLEIRALCIEGVLQREIAIRFGIARRTVSMIFTRETWDWLS